VFTVLLWAVTDALSIESATGNFRDTMQEYAKELKHLATEMLPDIDEATNIIDRGICQFRGMCRSNPATSCKDVNTQDGVIGKTILPDGTYWIKPPTKSNSRVPPVFRSHCLSHA